jgi:hypothetical protein
MVLEEDAVVDDRDGPAGDTGEETTDGDEESEEFSRSLVTSASCRPNRLYNYDREARLSVSVHIFRSLSTDAPGAPSLRHRGRAGRRPGVGDG